MWENLKLTLFFPDAECRYEAFWRHCLAEQVHVSRGKATPLLADECRRATHPVRRSALHVRGPEHWAALCPIWRPQEEGLTHTHTHNMYKHTQFSYIFISALGVLCCFALLFVWPCLLLPSFLLIKTCTICSSVHVNFNISIFSTPSVHSTVGGDCCPGNGGPDKHGLPPENGLRG